MLNAIVEYGGVKMVADLGLPLDISLPLHSGPDQVQAWYVGPLVIEPVRTEHFTGSVKEGGSVNFRNISFNPHGHGTHTECVGHIAPEVFSINKALANYHFVSRLISLRPEKAKKQAPYMLPSDNVITAEQLHEACGEDVPEALVIRTLPNTNKTSAVYSNTNPAYLTSEAATWLVKEGVKHLLLDLPSVDREDDGGELNAHHIFWNFPSNPRHDATITEMIFVADHIKDGLYLLNLAVAPFENDASPSRPVLYSLQEMA
jgi:arylformamidase